MYFEPDTSLLDAAQAACVALPAAGVPVALKRIGGRGWALVAPLLPSVILLGTFLLLGKLRKTPRHGSLEIPRG